MPLTHTCPTGQSPFTSGPHGIGSSPHAICVGTAATDSTINAFPALLPERLCAPGNLEPGTYSVRVCPYPSTQVEPLSYTGTFSTSAPIFLEGEIEIEEYRTRREELERAREP